MKKFMLFILLAVSTAAQAFEPTRPVQIIVPFAVGGNTDVMARVVAQRFEEVTKQRFLVVNRPGANGTIAARAARSSNNDGHTLMFVSTSLLFAQLQRQPGVDYDMRTAFEYVGVLGITPTKIFARPDFAEDTATLIRNLQQGKNYRIAVGNAATEFATKLLLQKTKNPSTVIPYTNSAMYWSDIMAGRVDLALNAGIDGIVNSALATGRMRQVAVLDAKSNAANTVDALLPGMIHYSWYGFGLPPGTSSEIVRTYQVWLRDMLQDPQMQSRLRAMHLNLYPNTSPQHFRKVITDDFNRYSAVASQ